MHKAAVFRKLGMDFTTVRGPNPALSIEWTAALGKGYIWTMVTGRDFDAFCRQVSIQLAATKRAGITTALHNHLGSPVETQDQLEQFMARVPECGLVLDTAHLAAAGGAPVEIVRKYAKRLTVVHVKDWVTLKPEVGLDKWTERGRFCELGAGNIGLDNAAVMRALRKVGYNGWVFVEHDTHLRDPIKDLAHSRQYLRKAGF